jgi:hypothetical protein
MTARPFTACDGACQQILQKGEKPNGSARIGEIKFAAGG